MFLDLESKTALFPSSGQQWQMAIGKEREKLADLSQHTLAVNKTASLQLPPAEQLHKGNRTLGRLQESHHPPTPPSLVFHQSEHQIHTSKLRVGALDTTSLLVHQGTKILRSTRNYE